MDTHKKLFVSGGHLAPALAVIQQLRKTHPAWTIIFIGRTVALEGWGKTSEESRVVMGEGIRFLPILTGRLNRTFSFGSLLSLLKVPVGFLQALWYCVAQRPDAVISFGGYIALPLALAGWLVGIPILTHEQTVAPGLANKIIGFFAKRICVSFADVRAQFPKTKTVYTGLPIRQEIFFPPPAPSFVVPARVPIIYVTGGTTGAVTLNEYIFAVVPRLVDTFVVVHATGQVSYAQATKLAATLPPDLQSRYLVHEYIPAADVAWLYAHAAMVVGRSGANTVGEIATVGQSAVLIPLPWSAGGEQEKNAQLLVSHKTSIVIHQKELTTELLRHAIDTIYTDRTYKQKAAKLAALMPRDGAARVVREIEALLCIPS